MSKADDNKALVMECMAAMGTFERAAYEPFLADEPVYWVNMHRQVGKEAIYANMVIGRAVYPDPGAATTEVIATLADGNWVAVLLIRRAPTNRVANYENMYAIFCEIIDDKIATFVENYDTAVAAQAFDLSVLGSAGPGDD